MNNAGITLIRMEAVGQHHSGKKSCKMPYLAHLGCRPHETPLE